jgi:UDP-3-O-acyl-N-acetylglucosamine deacetylase
MFFFTEFHGTARLSPLFIMEILQGDDATAMMQDRVPDGKALPVPDHFSDNRLGIRSDTRYTLQRSIGLGHSRSTFWNMPIEVQLYPHTEQNSPTLVRADGHTIPSTIENVRTGMHNIEVTDGRAGVGILEHPNAVQTALGVDMNIGVTLQNNPLLRQACQSLGVASPSISLPTNPDCNQPYLTAMHNNLVSTGDAEYITVGAPVGFRFGKNSYVVLEPDEGRHELVVDQQIEYPDIPPLGNQRMRTTMTPELFGFIAAARTPAIRTRANVLRLIKGMSMSRFPYTSLGLSNVVLVTSNGIANPNQKFVEGDTNYEIMCHELIDKIGWLKFIETEFGRKFVGKITLNRTNHAREIEVARALCAGELVTQESGMENSIDVKKLAEAA